MYAGTDGRHLAAAGPLQPVGAFVGEQDELDQVLLDATGTPPPDAAALAELQASVVLAPHRIIGQDAAFGLQGLVDVALKALSPGINDTTTAIMAVDQLGQLLRRLAGCAFPAQLRADEQGRGRGRAGPPAARLCGANPGYRLRKAGRADAVHRVQRKLGK